MKKITVLDLFSGIGGFHLGLEKAGYKVKSYFSEIDKHPIAVYKNNFKNSTYVGSVTDVRKEQLPKINLITFGSPCQDFSLAGNRKGMGGERSSLILEAIRLIDECRPRVFIWENVKGTFSSNSGKDFASILQAFTNIGGYRLEWQLCNTAWILLQNRERVYLVGYSTKTKRDWKGVFPIRISPPTPTKVSNGHAQISNFSPREFKFRDTSPALLSRDYKDPKIVKNADSLDSVVVNSLNENQQKKINTGDVRRLTPIECERLQGFPDDWTSEGNYDGEIKPVSNTQRYKMCGNAVTVNIVSEVVKNCKAIL